MNRGQYHSQGVSGHAAGTVFHRNSWPEDTTFDTHAAFPHATLFDRVDGGFSGASGGSGGSDANQPNHMRDLVLWNFKDLGAKSGVSKNWWQLGVSKYGRVLMPKLIGWHGVLPLFDSSQLALNESFGQPVEPESLYEAQLALRLGKLPDWLVELNGDDHPNTPSGLHIVVTPSGDTSAITPIAVTASTDDGNVPANTLDNNLSTRWSAQGEGQWIQFDLGSTYTIDSLGIAFYKGDQRSTNATIQVSPNAREWTTVWDAFQPESTINLKAFDFADTRGRYVRIVGYGNTANNWNSITEVKVYAINGSNSSNSG